ncbi:MAG: phosphomannose isomerase type II C-terminal cupin domain [Kordiimonadaceae bacterium]|jgi:mannose-6-phosphate isomerase-like protein (cupin superfamily)|nr:phosphomannose isomerase type II C-terminal cupin domain [Kordiimonadaceae bacterium]
MNEFTDTAWGAYEILSEGDNFQVKRLRIDPWCCMSYQRHWGRSENWNVVKGTLGFCLEGGDYDLESGDFLEVSTGSWHAAYNMTTSPVEVIEVWVGGDLREDDIERKPYTGVLLSHNWKYGRNDSN